MPRGAPDVAMVGGGIGGIAAALALHRRDIAVTVYEQAETMREAGSGLMLWPNGSRVMRELGLLEAVLACSGASTRFAIRDAGGAVLRNIPLGRFDAPALCIRRADLLAVLLAAFPADRIRLNHRLTRLRAETEGVRLEFGSGASAIHGAVIGADGLRSQVRTALFGEIAPVYRGYTIWRGVAPYDGTGIERGCNSETWGPGQRFGVLDTGGGRFTWYATANLPAGTPDRPAGRKAELLARFNRWHAPIAQVIEQTPETAILKNGAYDLPVLRRWGRGRVSLLGDAAHPCTPNLGQGGCMALEDALALAQCLTEDAPIESSLRKYEALRRTRTRRVQQRSRLLGSLGQWEDDILVAARRWLTRTIPTSCLERALSEIYAFRV